MKRVNKLAAAITLALGAGAMAPGANAEIYLKSNGVGDALIFPVYNGYVDNYFTISNSSNQWIQGHLRFRGATWCTELRDFDVMLSPGDVFLFRVADFVADSADETVKWEIDQSLDIRNFQYTGHVQSCGSQANCMNPNDRLIEPVCPAPSASSRPNQAECDHQATVGYIEFIGEAVLDNMTPAIMNDLLNPSLPSSDRNKLYQDTLYQGIGTNTWKWSDAPAFETCATAFTPSTAGASASGDACDMGLSDVPNVLSGTAFIIVPGRSTGLTYNAEVFVNFRTPSGWGTHRIDNYHVVDTNYNHRDGNDSNQATMDSAVILHDESGADGNGPTPYGDYVFHFVDDAATPDDRIDETLVAFNNTWGPTLADGDDYSSLLSQWGWRDTDADFRFGGNPELDDWEVQGIGDHFLPVHGISQGNSIAEIEEAIRRPYGIDASAQTFTSYYFDGSGLANGNALTSWYFVHFMTKYFYGEEINYWNINPVTLNNYIREASRRLVQMGKPVTLEIWDINEVPGTITRQGCISPDPCSIQADAVLAHELTFFGIDWFKQVFNTGVASSFTHGRVVISAVDNNPRVTTGGNPDRAIPMRAYTFESGGADIIGQWRLMNH